MTEEIRLYCPLRGCSVRCVKPSYLIKKFDNPPFFYTPQTAITKLMEHIMRDHSFREILTFFEEHIAEEYLQLLGE